MNAKPQNRARWTTVAAVSVSCIAAFSSQLKAEDLRGETASGLARGAQLPPVNMGEARLDAMGPTDACTEMRPITAVGTNIGVKPGANERPEDVGSVCHPARAEAAYTMTARAWAPVCYCWEAPALCYGPLYFEETNLERHGYSQMYLRGVQPLVSSAHFFGTVSVLPYLLVAEPPRECVYTLGEYRPGSCVPFQWNYPYFSPGRPLAGPAWWGESGK
jgi:hypothetical protein